MRCRPSAEPAAPKTRAFFLAGPPDAHIAIFTLSPENAADYLAARLQVGTRDAKADVLGGGVSSVVLRIAAGGRAWILKQPRRRFRVAQTWEVDPARAAVEARFARLVRERMGPVVPAVLDHEPRTHVLIFEAAPLSYEPWKGRLLAGKADAAVAGAAGKTLAQIHRLGADPAWAEPDLFEQQRLDPYLAAAAARQPLVAKRLLGLRQRLAADRTALIHGDYSPKNILTDGEGLLLVDHEVATLGDPRFDVAFLVNHLLLKAFHGLDPERAADLVDEFLYRYGRAGGPARVDASLGEILAALMLARVDGKSPVEYLRPRDQERVRLLSLRALHAGAIEPLDLIHEALESLKG